MKFVIEISPPRFNEVVVGVVDIDISIGVVDTLPTRSHGRQILSLQSLYLEFHIAFFVFPEVRC